MFSSNRTAGPGRIVQQVPSELQWVQTIELSLLFQELTDEAL